MPRDRGVGEAAVTLDDAQNAGLVAMVARAVRAGDVGQLVLE